MDNLDGSLEEKDGSQEMIFGKSMTIDDEDFTNVASAANVSSVFNSVEAEFIENLKAGDSAAFDALINRYSGDVYALLYRLTEDIEEANDLTQETFLSVIKAIKSFRGDSGLKTWLYRIAINQSRNRFRWWKRRQRDKSISLDAPIGESDITFSDLLTSNTVDPETAAITHERETAIRLELIKLPDIYREVIVLCDIEGISYEDISRMLEINIGTVKSRLARGREELRKRLKDF